LKSQNILLLGLASLIFGCEGPPTSDEAGLLDAVAFVTGGQQEGTMPQGFETRWRRTVRGREIEYQSIGQNTGFDQANDPHRQSGDRGQGLDVQRWQMPGQYRDRNFGIPTGGLGARD
jgi:hypothetical protein